MAEEVDVDIEGDENEASRGAPEDLPSEFGADHYLDSVWRSDNDLTPWTLDSTISKENKAAIEKMLLEEEYYLSNKPLSATFWPQSKDGEKRCIKRSPQKKISRVPIRSSAKPATSPVKWTTEEKELFEQGVAEFGRRWTNISRLIGSRTVLQVKSYARQYFKNKCKLEDCEKEESKSSPTGLLGFRHGDHEEDGVISDELPVFRGRADPNLNAVKIEKLSDDEDIDITDEMDEMIIEKPDPSSTNRDNEGTSQRVAQETPVLSEPLQTEDLNSEPLCEQADIADKELFHSSACLSHNDNIECTDRYGPGLDSSPDPQQLPVDTDFTASANQSPAACDNDYDNQEEGDELKPPDQEMEIDRNSIMEEEKQAIPEFFEGRPAKTPERYLRIRNYILDRWEECKPKYLNKTSVRPGLKNCGDVNCIGRVHMYLELIGAINFGCEQAVYNRPRPVDKIRSKEGKDTLEAYELAHRLQSMRTRRRRVRDPWGNWCDAKDLEGQTFEHLSAEEIARRREEKIKLPKCSKGSRQTKSSLDPFKLIPCSAFNEDKPEPFRVKVAAEAMLVLDLHAHVSMAEVIGLLGGRYSESEGVVEIWAAEPCNSLSTGMQCEMDPVSQTLASEALAERGYGVIGWYHSHPAFDPNPSIRDIDTQAKYQSYFSRGGAKFLGMIISPYNRSNPLPQSQVSCLIIGDDLSEDQSYRMPYRFEVEHMSGEPLWDVVFEKTRWIIEKYRLSHSSVPMNRKFRRDTDMTCLQKLLSSMRKTLLSTNCTHVADAFLTRIEDLFRSSYTSAKDADAMEEPEESQSPKSRSTATTTAEMDHFLDN
ncbi:deubiquitinase MYSM1 [Spea bombifrons]|uniref:deubiquitinase MYSM1 n=1 Tax=Spea bombifrons TaxID=233779 RepID=UPI00234A48E6|nr:deubiquitinase MYSM1 [Spea bombifrons]